MSKKRISKRTREQAAMICAMCASGRQFAVYVEDVEQHGGPLYDSAKTLAKAAIVAVEHDRLAKGSGPGWTRDDRALAESMLRTGWTP